jgi:hypothetical protein
VRDATDQWSLLQKLVAPDPAPGDGFGGTLALEGDTLLVSAANDDVDGLKVRDASGDRLRRAS